KTMSRRIGYFQDAITSRLDKLTSSVKALQLDVAAIKNVVCCSGVSQYVRLPRHDKENRVEEIKAGEDSTIPKITINHASQVDSATQPRVSRNKVEGENANQPDLDRRYCISKAIQKNITKLIDVLPYQTCELQDLLLQSESCLTENENDLIKKQPTRRDQIRQLIRFVKGRSFKVISKFLQCSRDYNPEIIDLIWQTYDQLVGEGVRETRCVFCRMTNAVDIKDVADYAYEQEVLSDEQHRQITDCTHGVGAQTKLWHQLSVLSLKNGNNKILLDSILTYLCSTPKYKQYGEELKVLVKRNLRLECSCKDYKRRKMYDCNRVESFASSIFSSSVCPASSISNLTPRHSFRSLCSNSSGSQKRKPGNLKVKDVYFRPNIQRRLFKQQISKDEQENTSPKYIHCSQHEVSNGVYSTLSNRNEETNPKICISSHNSEKYKTSVLDSEYISRLSPISSTSENVESQEKTKDADETTMKVVHRAGIIKAAGGKINRRSATRKTWPLNPRSFCLNTEADPFEDLSAIASDVCEEDNEEKPLVHSHSYHEDCPCSITLPRLSIFQTQDTEFLRNHIPGSTQEATLPSDRHEMMQIFLQDVLEENERTSGTEDKVCYLSLKRTNSTPASLTSSSQTVSETESTSSTPSLSTLNDADMKRICNKRNSLEEKDDAQYRTFSSENETKEANLLNSSILLCGSRGCDHNREGESDVKFNRNLSTQTSSDLHIDNSSSTTFSNMEIKKCCSNGELSSLEMQNSTRHRTYTVHSKYTVASEPDISSTGTVRPYTVHRKASNSLSDTSRDATKEKRLHFGSLGWKRTREILYRKILKMLTHPYLTSLLRWKKYHELTYH
ncbi:hypothetical protein CHS0354_022595, partial [Potamilus streckersoni]